MSILSKLKLSNETRSGTLANPIERKREKLITAIQYQINALEAADKGEEYTYPVMKHITHPETGVRTRQSIRQRVRPWWWQDMAGKVFTCVKYGNKKLELAKGKQTIEVPDMKALTQTYKQLSEAVKAGELDDALTAVARFGAKKR